LIANLGFRCAVGELQNGIHFLTSRTSDHSVETLTSGPRFTDAVADAKSQCAGVKIRNQSVIGYMIRDNGGYEVTRWYAETPLELTLLNRTRDGLGQDVLPG
jgi:hypothetical protein